MEKEWSISKKEIFKEFKSCENGLTNDEAKNRISQYGENKITKKKEYKILKIILNQINSPLIYILIFAAIISFIAHSKLDAYVIGIIVLINTTIGFFQQYKAENAIQKLSNLIEPKVKVIREGTLQIIGSKNLVPGDLVILEEGDKITADMRIINSDGIEVNESILTGESTPIIKKESIIDAQTPIEKRINMVFAGCEVLVGRATAIVVKTGDNSIFGSLANKLQTMKSSQTPMQKRIDKLSKNIGIIILILVALIFILGLSSNSNILELFMISITLAVGAIPEGLPAVMAIAFSVSSNIMTKKNVLIRKLPAVEGLGSVSVICTDKTGTITKEKLEIQKIFNNNQLYDKIKHNLVLNKKLINLKENPELSKIFEIALLSSNAKFQKNNNTIEYFGDPTEKVLIKAGLELGLNKKLLTEKFPRIKTFNFDAKRKMMSILRDNKRNNILYTKGAPEKVLQICTLELLNGKIKKLSSKRKEEIKNHIRNMEHSGLRVLGFAYKTFSKKEKVEEKSLIFTGIMGMIDPPRDEVKDAILKCQDAGILVKMITGDSLITGKTIAKKVGITGEAINCDEISNWSDELLQNRINEYSIFTRATPEQKLRIANALQKQGHTVAMTGDGVNDVLALKSADIGIAMGIRGTDVARDVSDIILKDDNFASIVKGVEQGRITYDNIKRFIKYMLSVNFSIISLVTLTFLMGLPLPLIPLQILWRNIITDSLPAISLVFEKGENVMKSPPRKEKSILSKTLPFIIFIGLLNLIAHCIVYFYGIINNIEINLLRTIVLMTGIIFEVSFIYSCRSDLPTRLKGFFSNKFLNISVITAFTLNIFLMYSKFGKLFYLEKLPLQTWLLIIPIGLSGLIINEIVKEIKYKKTKNK